MALARHYPDYTTARAQLRGVLDSARAGLVTTVVRDGERYVIHGAEQQREQLSRLLPSGTMVTAEGGGWSAILPGAPVHGDAMSFDGAVADLVEALREYAADWNDELRTSPNHMQHRTLVELVELSDDDQLREWLLQPSTAARPPRTA